MLNRQNESLNNESIDLLNYFQQPRSAGQKHYEAVRAVVVDLQPAETVAERFGYTTTTVYSLVRDAKAGKLELFPIVSKGPQGPRTDPEIQHQIIAYRRQGLSCTEIALHLPGDCDLRHVPVGIILVFHIRKAKQFVVGVVVPGSVHVRRRPPVANRIIGRVS
jgi:hypothetical protein